MVANIAHMILYHRASIQMVIFLPVWDSIPRHLKGEMRNEGEQAMPGLSTISVDSCRRIPAQAPNRPAHMAACGGATGSVVMQIHELYHYVQRLWNNNHSSSQRRVLQCSSMGCLWIWGGESHTSQTLYHALPNAQVTELCTGGVNCALCD